MPQVTAPGQAPETNVQTFSDFTGGLNLVSDNFKLAPNESPNMVNVDLDHRGGVSRRNGWVERSLASWQSRSVGTVDNDLTAQYHKVFQTTVNTLYYWPGAATTTQLVRNATGVGAGRTPVVDNAVVAADTGWTALWMDWTTYEGLSYGTRGWAVTPTNTIRYNAAGVAAGTASSIINMTDSNSAYQNDYDVPSGVHFPFCRYTATHNDTVWAAYTHEGATPFPSRVRWSHPGDAGSWRQNDFIDIDVGNDGDSITGIVSFRDQLLVFKRKAVYAVTGYSPDTFQVVKISDTIGAVHRGAIVAADVGVFFFDPSVGVFLYDGQNVQYLFEKIYPAMLNNTIQSVSLTRLAWLNRRLWVNVRWTDPQSANAGKSFIWDPRLGAWTMYEPFIAPGEQSANAHVRTGFDHYDGDEDVPYVELSYNALGVDVSSITEVDIDGVYQDTIASVISPVDARYRTPWIDLGDAARLKRWKRPEFVLSGGYNQVTSVDVMRDWNSSAVVKTLQLETFAATGVVNWDAVNWGAFSWSEIEDLYDVVVRGGSVGSTGRSLSFTFIAPDDGNVWDLNAYMIKWRNKRIKG